MSFKHIDIDPVDNGIVVSVYDHEDEVERLAFTGISAALKFLKDKTKENFDKRSDISLEYTHE